MLYVTNIRNMSTALSQKISGGKDSGKAGGGFSGGKDSGKTGGGKQRIRVTKDYGPYDNFSEALEHGGEVKTVFQGTYKCWRCNASGKVSFDPTDVGYSSPQKTTLSESKIRELGKRCSTLSLKNKRKTNVASRLLANSVQMQKRIELLEAQLTNLGVKPEGFLGVSEFLRGKAKDVVHTTEVKAFKCFNDLIKKRADSVDWTQVISNIGALCMSLSTCNDGFDVVVQLSAELLRRSHFLLGEISNVSTTFKDFLIHEANKSEDVKPEGAFQPVLDFMSRREMYVDQESAPPVIAFVKDAVACVTFFMMAERTADDVNEDYVIKWLRAYRNQRAHDIFDCAYQSVYTFFEFLDTWHDCGVSLSVKRLFSCNSVALDLAELEAEFTYFSLRDEKKLGKTLQQYISDVNNTVNESLLASKHATARVSTRVRMEALYTRAKALQVKVDLDYAQEIVREQPFAWGVYGVPRCGKSMIFSAVNRAIGSVGEFPTGEPNYFHHNQDDEYASGYNNNITVYLADDVGNAPEVNGKTPEMSFCIKLINNVPYITVQAELHKKGIISAKPKIFTMTTNHAQFAIPQATTCLESYAKRFILSAARVKKKYANPDGSLNKVAAKGAGIYDTHDFGIYTLAASSKKSKSWKIVSDERFPGQSLVKDGDRKSVV